jgi:transcriptional regulator with XRE-family HTH domain
MPEGDPKMELKLLLRNAMIERGWSPAQLAKNARLSRSTISDALNDAEGVPNTSTIEALCRALWSDPERQERQKALVGLRNQAASAAPSAAAASAVASRPVAHWSGSPGHFSPRPPQIPA